LIIPYKTYLNRFLFIILISYRIENAIDKDILEYPNAIKKYLLNRRILHAVIIHRKAIELVFSYFLFLMYFILYIFSLYVYYFSIDCDYLIIKLIDYKIV